MFKVINSVLSMDNFDLLFKDREVIVEGLGDIPINGYVAFRAEEDDNIFAMARYVGEDRYQLVRPDRKRSAGVISKDSSQTAFIDALLNPNIMVNIAIGSAGTGKTTIAVAYATQAFMQDPKKKILLSKPTTMVGSGKAFGPVPGDIGEKYAPYLASFNIVISNNLGDKSPSYVQQMIAKKDIEFIPLELSRGCTYRNCTFILDEAQNTSWHEINTLMSRMGENSKLIILGDLDQIDTKIPRHKTGLSLLTHARPFRDSDLTSTIELEVQYRSPICKLATEVGKWIRDHE